MNSENLTHRPQEQIQAESVDSMLSSQEQIKPESILFIIAAAAGLSGLAFLLLRKTTDKERFFVADPPPIFIKSGSFVIESDIDLNESTGGPPYHYKRIGFGPILGVRVFKYNEIYGVSHIPQEIDYTAGSTGLVVKIWLQRAVGNQWGTTATNPEIIIRNIGNDFDLELKFTQKLDPRNKKHKKRAKKYEDKENYVFRFGKIQVNSYNPITTTVEGDEYTIGFYNVI